MASTPQFIFKSASSQLSSAGARLTASSPLSSIIPRSAPTFNSNAFNTNDFNIGGGSIGGLGSLGGGNIPGLGGDSAAQAGDSTGFKVRLVSILQMINNSPSEIAQHQVIFDVTPTLSESGAVEYSPVMPVHMPGGVQVYKNTQPRQFEIGAHFISRNTADALKNIQNLQRLRSWRYPFFGASSTTTSSNPKIAESFPEGFTLDDLSGGIGAQNPQTRIRTGGVELLGAPPEVLYLYAYSTTANDERNDVAGINLNRIPVVMTNLSIQYPDDVDYIPIQLSPTGKTEPFPVKMDVTITVVESHSPVEFEKFSLNDYKNGILKNW